MIKSQVFIKLTFIIILTLIFICSSCNFEGNLNPIEENSSDLNSIESMLIFTINYDSTQSFSEHIGFILIIKTEKIYGCAGYSIECELLVESNQIEINLLGIHKPDVCEDACRAARAWIPLDLSSGDYNLFLKYKFLRDDYLISVNDLSVVVTKLDTSFTEYQEFDLHFYH